MISCRSSLNHKDWRYVHAARLDILPLHGYSWCTVPDKTCRRCTRDVETGYHVLNNCQMGLVLATQRHDSVLDLLVELLRRQGHQVTVNKAVPGNRLRPDIEFRLSGSQVFIDVAISYDSHRNLELAWQRKVSKYEALGTILPLVVGSLGSWFPRNEEIRSLLGIDSRSWGAFRQKARVAAVKGSTVMIDKHLHGGGSGPDRELPAELHHPSSDEGDTDDDIIPADDTEADDIPEDRSTD